MRWRNLPSWMTKKWSWQLGKNMPRILESSPPNTEGDSVGDRQDGMVGKIDIQADGIVDFSIVDALEKSGFIDFVYKGYLFTTASVLHTLTAFPVEIGSDDFLIHSHASMQPHPNLYGLDVLFSRACHPRPVDLTRLVLQDV